MSVGENDNSNNNYKYRPTDGNMKKKVTYNSPPALLLRMVRTEPAPTTWIRMHICPPLCTNQSILHRCQAATDGREETQEESNHNMDLSAGRLFRM